MGAPGLPVASLPAMLRALVGAALLAVGCATGDHIAAPSSLPGDLAAPIDNAAASLLASPAPPASSPEGAEPAGEARQGSPPCGAGSLPPLTAPSPFIALPVERHHPAVVSLPLGATSPRPVLVVAHGAGDRPEWQCGVWREIVQDRAFVLCVRGFPTNPYVPERFTGYFYTDHHALGREIGLALASLRERFPEHADMTAPAYAGFSQGAIQGAMLLPGHPARFSRAALVEGGYGFFQEWNIPVAQRFQRRGGQRVLLACGRVRCVEQARVSAFYMRRAGLEAEVIHAEGAGHSYGGRMKEAVHRAFSWVVEGDERWCPEDAGTDGADGADGADER